MSRVYKQCKGGTLHLIKIPLKYRSQISQTAKQALANASKLFGYHRYVEIVIFSSAPDFVIPQVGIGAHATIQGDVVVNIDFLRRDITRVIKNELPSTLYHELSHVVRKSVHQDLYETLLESLVTEGIASYIEKKVFGKNVPYIKRIRNEREYWQKARKDMNKKTYNHAEWFFGRGKLPRWIGYRLGYLLVDSFMKRRKNLSFAQLARTESRKVARESQLL